MLAAGGAVVEVEEGRGGGALVELGVVVVTGTGAANQSNKKQEIRYSNLPTLVGVVGVVEVVCAGGCEVLVSGVVCGGIVVSDGPKPRRALGWLLSSLRLRSRALPCGGPWTAAARGKERRQMLHMAEKCMLDEKDKNKIKARRCPSEFMGYLMSLET